MPIPAPASAKFPCLCLRLSLGLIAFAIPAAASAQVTYTGATATQNFGSQPIGTPSAARTFSFSVAAGTTVGSIAVVTQGAPNLDFTSATGGTCTAQTYASTTTCTVNVTFNPKGAGLRMGAVVFFSATGNTAAVLGSVPVFGGGSGPLVGFDPSVTATLGDTGQNRIFDVNSIAPDAAGDLFVTDGSDGGVDEFPAGGGPAILIEPTANGLETSQSGVAVDGAGDLFIADWFNNRVVELPVGGGTPIAIDPTVTKSLYEPTKVTVDGAGNLFIADFKNNRVVKVPPNGGAASVIDPLVDGYRLKGNQGMAVDSAGDLFIADTGNNRLVEIPANGSPAIAVDSGVVSPVDVAIDTDGALIVDCNCSDNPTFSQSVAVDGAGDLFIGNDGSTYGFFESQRPKPPSLTFPTTTFTGTVDTTDKTQTVELINIGNEPLVLGTIDYPADFSAGTGDTNVCTASMTLTPGQQCNIPIQFTPVNGGMLSEEVTIADNAMNVTGGQQSIPVSGNALALATMTSPTPGSILGSSNVTFTWKPGTGTAIYNLWLGLSGPGSSSLYASGVTTATSVTVPTIPIKGATVYARLFSEINGVFQHTDYTYKESSMVPATLTAPAPSTTLPGPSATFQWSTAAGATTYELNVGTTGVGSKNLVSSGQTTATSFAFAALPTNGQTVYVGLSTNFNGTWINLNYTYTAAAQAVLASPTPGATLTSSSQTFTWTPATGSVTEYSLWIGTTGVGSNNLLGAPNTTATSITFTHLPTAGQTIYVRLFTNFNGSWRYTDYTYTAE
jgi:hypothetical protein